MKKSTFMAKLALETSVFRASLIFCCLVSLFLVGLLSCGTGNWTPPKEDPYYKQIKNNTITYDEEAGNPDLYMFVYNTGDETINHEKYNDILKTKFSSRNVVDEHQYFDFESLEFMGEDFSNYTCGLSLETVRKAGKNFRIRKQASTRAIKENDDNDTSDDETGKNDYGEEPEKPKEYDRKRYKTASEIGDEANFYTIFTDEDGTEGTPVINAVCVYVNDVCQVFVEDGWYGEDGYHENNYYAGDASINSYVQSNKDDYNSIKVTRNGVRLIADGFKKIYQPEQAVLGNADLDFIWKNNSNIIETSEKITILISNLGKKKSGHATLGYFYPEDLRCDCDYDGLIEDEDTLLYSNQRLMFTINTIGFSESFGGENAIISTLAHEFNHMLNYINKTIKNSRNGKLEYETWFTEMLSLTAEDFMAEIAGIPNTVQKNRLPYFLRWPYRGMINWQNDTDNSYYYGYAYAFGAYLVRNYGGIKLLNEIATNSYSSGKDSIKYGLWSTSSGFPSYESALKNFGLVYINTDGTKFSVDEDGNITKYPTLNKELSETFKNYDYNLSAIDLDSFNSRRTDEDVTRFKRDYSNPKWTDNTHGACFYKVPPDNIYAGGFYAAYLGKASDYDYELKFNPPSSYGGLQAYIFADYPRKNKNF